MSMTTTTTNGPRRSKLSLFILLYSCASTAILHNSLRRVRPRPLDDRKAARSSSTPLLPTCHPHWNASAPPGGAATPIARIYFYHFRKAGGTMIHEYLRKVALHHGIDLAVKEYNHAAAEEEVGSRPDTIYVTNMRDPVERSISHFKYSGRWDCDQLTKNKSFVPTEDNAQPFELWNETRGFEPSDCDIPFSFISCAVNCYIQTFSGIGCTDDHWATEYNLAHDRLLRYNMILVYEQFKDPNYVKAVEHFFGGVEGFNQPAWMFCGREARAANERVPLAVKFEHVRKLTQLNEMDNRLYRDIARSCWEYDEKGNVEYSFPRVNTSRFIAPRNRTAVELHNGAANT